MSLINDALKRARDESNQPQRPSAPPAPPPRFTPPPATISSGSRSAFPAVVAVIALVIGAGGFYAFSVLAPVRGLKDKVSVAGEVHESHSPAVAKASAPVAKRSQTETKPAAAIAANVSEQTDAKPTEEQLIEQVLVKLKEQQAAESAAVQAPPPEPPKLVLQGITRGRGPSEAMINGYTVREGEEIEGARVIAIESRGVTMQFGGREFFVRMP